jgi:hypothetical protein
LRIKLKKKNEGDKTDYTIIRLSYNSWCWGMLDLYRMEIFSKPYAMADDQAWGDDGRDIIPSDL